MLHLESKAFVRESAPDSLEVKGVQHWKRACRVKGAQSPVLHPHAFWKCCPDYLSPQAGVEVPDLELGGSECEGVSARFSGI